MSKVTRHLLEAIARYICRRLETDTAKPAMTVLPNLIERLTDEQRVTLALFDRYLIRKIEAEKKSVIMRTLRLIAILTAMVVLDLATIEEITEPLEELLMVAFGQR